MRVLLDEMLDRRLRRFLPDGIEALTVRERGWGSLQNGELLEAAQQEFDVLLTTDRGIPHQQNLERFDVAVIVLSAKSNNIADHEPLMPEVSRLIGGGLPDSAPDKRRWSGRSGMNDHPRAGGCMCRGVRFEVSGEPEASSICHCASCRKSVGAQSVAWIVFPYESFRLVAGEPAMYRSSERVSRTFCGECGTTLTYRHDDDPDSIDITAASLDSPDEFPPTRRVWLEDKPAWETVGDDLCRFERGSSDDDSFR